MSTFHHNPDKNEDIHLLLDDDLQLALALPEIQKPVLAYTWQVQIW
jgi:hypothetical protein